MSCCCWKDKRTTLVLWLSIMYSQFKQNVLRPGAGQFLVSLHLSIIKSTWETQQDATGSQAFAKFWCLEVLERVLSLAFWGSRGFVDCPNTQYIAAGLGRCLVVFAVHNYLAARSSSAAIASGAQDICALNVQTQTGRGRDHLRNRCIG